jgi:hypothetical protein
MKYVTFRCDQNTLILNEIFMLGKRGVTGSVRFFGLTEPCPPLHADEIMRKGKDGSF